MKQTTVMLISFSLQGHVSVTFGSKWEGSLFMNMKMKSSLCSLMLRISYLAFVMRSLREQEELKLYVTFERIVS